MQEIFDEIFGGSKIGLQRCLEVLFESSLGNRFSRIIPSWEFFCKIFSFIGNKNPETGFSTQKTYTTVGMLRKSHLFAVQLCSTQLSFMNSSISCARKLCILSGSRARMAKGLRFHEVSNLFEAWQLRKYSCQLQSSDSTLKNNLFSTKLDKI